MRIIKKKLVLLISVALLFCNACSENAKYLTSEELSQMLKGTWRVMLSNGNHFATYVFVDDSHYYEIKGNDYYGYLEPYIIDAYDEETKQETEGTSSNIGMIEMTNYQLNGSSVVLHFSLFQKSGQNSLSCKKDNSMYIFQKFSDDSTDNSKGDIFVAIEEKKNGKSSYSSSSKQTAKSSTSSLSNGQQKVTCSMCNGTGKVKYYYGEGSSQYNLGPCTSCDGKGYTMMTGKGSSDNGKNVICPSCGKYVKSLVSRKDKAGVTRKWCKDCWKEYDDIMG